MCHVKTNDRHANPRDGNPRSLQQWLGLDHQILRQPDSPREIGRRPGHSRKPISCSIARSMPISRWSGREFLRLRPCELKACVTKDHLALPCAPESPAGLTQSGTVFPSTTTVPSQRRHQSVCPLRSWKSGRQSSTTSICVLERQQVQVPHEHICFAIPARQHFPERTLDDPAPLLARKLHGGWWPLGKWTATPAEARGGWEGGEGAARESGRNPSWTDGTWENTRTGCRPTCDLNSAFSVAESLGWCLQ